MWETLAIFHLMQMRRGRRGPVHRAKPAVELTPEELEIRLQNEEIKKRAQREKDWREMWQFGNPVFQRLSRLEIDSKGRAYYRNTNGSLTREG